MPNLFSELKYRMNQQPAYMGHAFHCYPSVSVRKPKPSLMYWNSAFSSYQIHFLHCTFKYVGL